MNLGGADALVLDVKRKTMSGDIASDYLALLKAHRELTAAVRMMRRAAESAVRAGVLPAIERDFHLSMTPLQECEAIARALYDAAAKQKHRAGASARAG